MSWVRALLTLALLAGAHASPLADPSKPSPSGAITWKPCEELEGPLPLQCGELKVPLDYSKPDSDKKLALQLAKVAASKKPKKGSILFNFGGPGVGARASFARQADLMQTITGGHYDLIAHDPRGTEKTLTFTCFNTTEESVAAMTQARYGDLVTPKDKAAIGRLYASAGIFGETCSQFPDAKAKGGLISTSYTARDLMQIVDAVEEDKMLRYFGFSYGTVLGATVAAMFPDRIDKIILDGVANPHQHYNTYDIEVWADTDKTFSGFFEQCVKAPDRCALARKGKTASEIEDSVHELLYNLKYRPLSHQGLLIDNSLVRPLIRPSLYDPALWPTLSVALDSLLRGNLTAFVEAQQTLQPPWAGGEVTEAPYGIPCSEKVTGKTKFDEVMPEVEKLNKQSSILGQMGTQIAMSCAQWPFEANERYEGDFKVKTKNPMFVIGNTYDPATPLRSARNVSSTFEDAVLLEHNGYGHCSTKHPSVCTGKAIKNYFNDGTLPKPGTICEPAYAPFANKTWKDVLPEI